MECWHLIMMRFRLGRANFDFKVLYGLENNFRATIYFIKLHSVGHAVFHFNLRATRQMSARLLRAMLTQCAASRLRAKCRP